jgi:CcmD family protein
MSGYLIAYVIVWLGVVLYVIRLGAEQRRLSRALEALRLQVEDPRNTAPSTIEAA